MAPMVPHLAEEVWSKAGGQGMVVDAAWPKADPAMLVSDSVVLPIQINGKRRGRNRGARTYVQGRNRGHRAGRRNRAALHWRRGAEKADRRAGADRQCRGSGAGSRWAAAGAGGLRLSPVYAPAARGKAVGQIRAADPKTPDRFALPAASPDGWARTGTPTSRWPTSCASRCGAEPSPRTR